MRRPAPAYPCDCPEPPATSDGRLVSIDSKSLHHEAKAAGIIYQATLRRELHAERGFEFNPVDPQTGMAEIAGVDPAVSRLVEALTRLRNGRATPCRCRRRPTAAQLAAAQKATRPTKPESLAWADLKQLARRRARIDVWTATHISSARRRRTQQRSALDRARIAEMAAHIDKPTFTRADMVELIGAQLPIDAPANRAP